jgi:hypothetical protein
MPPLAFAKMFFGIFAAAQGHPVAARSIKLHFLRHCPKPVRAGATFTGN